MNKNLKKLLLILILGRVLLLLITFATGYFHDGVNVINFLTKFGVRWDGNSYTKISEQGYILNPDFIVFPPVYPLIIRPLGLLLNNFPLAGMIMSNIFFILGSLIFHKLLLLDYSEKFSFYTVFLVSIFPTSYFFSVAYPEALFFLIFSVVFFLARTKNTKIAYTASYLAPLTRPFGVGIYASLFAGWISDKKRKFSDLFILIFSGAAAAATYLLINFLVFKNPFAFREVLQTTWQKSFTPPWVGIVASWKRGLFSPPSDYKILVGYAEAIASTIAWIFIIVSLAIKKFRLRIEYFTYLLIGVILFTSTGFILSAPRYLLSLPPFFIILAKLTESKIAKIIWIPLSIILLFVLSVRWLQGPWTF
jgi:hypothetical protein